MGTKEYPVQAAFWHQKASNQGLADAQVIQEQYYDGGEGVERDPVTATKWLYKAASQDNALAAFMLGRRYADG
jgi:TPR repeat protein